MAITETKIKVAAKLYEARDAMRWLWGEEFQAKIEPFLGFVRSEMKHKNCDQLTAAINIVRDLQRDRPDSGMSQVAVLAACVELIEPS